MKKNVSKVLSLMCSVAALSGIFGMNSVNAGGVFSKRTCDKSTAPTSQPTVIYDENDNVPIYVPVAEGAYGVNENRDERRSETEPIISSPPIPSSWSGRASADSCGPYGVGRRICVRMLEICEKTYENILRRKGIRYARREISYRLVSEFTCDGVLEGLKELFSYMQVRLQEFLDDRCFDILYSFIDSVLRDFNAFDHCLDLEELIHCEAYSSLEERVSDLAENLGFMEN